VSEYESGIRREGALPDINVELAIRGPCMSSQRDGLAAGETNEMRLRTVLFRKQSADYMTCREQTGLSGVFQLARALSPTSGLLLAEIVCGRRQGARMICAPESTTEVYPCAACMPLGARTCSASTEPCQRLPDDGCDTAARPEDLEW
jgi:hypothetical protein